MNKPNGRFQNESSADYYVVAMEYMNKKGSGGIPLALHAEMWWYESGNLIPLRNTAEWTAMYEQWVDYAFSEEK